jgi:hypothetical protein
MVWTDNARRSIATTFRRFSRGAAASLLALALFGAAAAAPEPPPGFNIHLVRETGSSRFWRGGAPRKDTLESLATAARKRGGVVTLFDLRKPANSDDRSSKAGRLSPADEESLARKLGLRYEAVSALDRTLPTRLDEALARGDVYMHCMYGVNRTGFATARYARAERVSVDKTGLGKHDWKQGDAFQAALRR